MSYINPNTRIVILTAEQHNRILTLCGAHQDLVSALIRAKDHIAATPDHTARAHELYGTDDIKIDLTPYTGTSEAEDGVWVQAWVWLPDEEN